MEQNNKVQKSEKILVILYIRSQYTKKNFMFHTLCPVIGNTMCALS